MKTKSNKRRNGGFSLSLVLVFTGVLFLLLSGVLAWTTTNSNLTQRFNEYYNAVAAAEAATEKVFARIARDFQNSGVTGVDGSLSSYGSLVPTPGEVSDWADYEFDDPSGVPNATYAAKLTAWQYTDLNWKYSGFKGYASTYRVISNARNTAWGHNITSAVRQEIQIASIPLFEFGVFYALDLEICPNPHDMTFNGRVHSNGSIYCEPSSPRIVAFLDHVTAAQKILHNNSPNDPNVRTLGTITYQAEHDWNVSSLNLPLGTDNNPTNLHALIEIPPGSEPINSLVGLQRYFNKADLVILVSNTTVTAKSCASNNFATTIDWTNINSFVNTNVSFLNSRETGGSGTMMVQATEIDLQQFNSSYGGLTTALGRPVKILYVADLRTQTVSTESGVSLVHGQILPSAGLTIATLNPLYVKGHYNAPDSCLGTTNTAPTCPASLICDAITILSDKWTDGNSTNSSRVANDTTINAAILAGIVPSDGSYYSGGLENFLRLMENWNSRILTFNGSLAALFPSRIATSPFGVGGSAVYSPPQQRAFSFDFNFKDVNKLPPGTPQLRTAIRAAWNMTQANSTQ